MPVSENHEGLSTDVRRYPDGRSSNGQKVLRAN